MKTAILNNVYEQCAKGSELRFSGVQTFLICRGGRLLPGNSDWEEVSSVACERMKTRGAFGEEERELFPHLAETYLVQSDDSNRRWFLCTTSWRVCLKSIDNRHIAEGSIRLLLCVKTPSSETGSLPESPGGGDELSTTTLICNISFGQKSENDPDSLMGMWSGDDIVRLAFSLYDKHLDDESWGNVQKDMSPVEIFRNRFVGSGAVSSPTDRPLSSLAQLAREIWKSLKADSAQCSTARVLQIDSILDENGERIADIDYLQKEYPELVSGLLVTDECWRWRSIEASTESLQKRFRPRTFACAYISGHNSLCMDLQSRDAVEWASSTLHGLVDSKLAAFHIVRSRTAGLRLGLFSSVYKHLELKVCLDVLASSARSAQYLMSNPMERMVALSTAMYCLKRHGIAEMRSLDNLISVAMGVEARYLGLSVDLERMNHRIEYASDCEHRSHDRSINGVLVVLTLATVIIEFLHMLHRQLGELKNPHSDTMWGVVVSCLFVAIVAIWKLGTGLSLHRQNSNRIAVHRDRPKLGSAGETVAKRFANRPCLRV